MEAERPIAAGELIRDMCGLSTSQVQAQLTRACSVLALSTCPLVLAAQASIAGDLFVMQHLERTAEGFMLSLHGATVEVVSHVICVVSSCHATQPLIQPVPLSVGCCLVVVVVVVVRATVTAAAGGA